MTFPHTIFHHASIFFACCLLVTGVCFALPHRADAAIAFVGTTTAANTASITSLALPARGHSAGNLIVVLVKYEGFATTVSVSDTTGNTYQGLTQRDHSNNDLHLRIFYAKSIRGSANNVITVNFAAARGFLRAVAVEYSGVNRVSPFDQEATGQCSSSCSASMSTGNITTTEDNELLVAIAGEYAAQNSGYTPGTGFTERYDFPINTGLTFPGSAVEDRVVTTEGTYNATMDQTTTDPWIMALASFKAARSTLSRPPNNLGLVGYWPFDEGIGTIATDFSGNRFSGTFGGANGPSWVSGKRGKALDFEQSLDGYISAGTRPDISALPFTVAAWVKPEDFPDFGTILAKRDTFAAGDMRFAFIINSGTGLVRLQSAASDLTSGYTPPLERWTHLSFVASSTGTGLYVNGVFQEQLGIFTLSNDAAAEVRIGQAGGGPDAFDGSIDEVRMYSRALSSSEIMALYKFGAAKVASSVDLDDGTAVGSGLVGHWSFDGKDVTDFVYDRSGQDNTAWFFNGATSSAKVPGKLGQALRFDGIDDYVHMTNVAGVTFDTPLTASIWINPSTYNPPHGDGYAVWLSTSNFLFGGQNDGTLGYQSGQSFTTLFSAIPLNTWTHLVYVVSGSTISLYINGAFVESDAYGAGGETFFGIGKDYSGDCCEFAGKLDDVRIYNRTLSPIEIKQLYRFGQLTVKP